ncbi:MAG: branched-chain amino acid ABC transporter permease [Patescibacteria group bacterium]|nr:branched-chain amino acid ABC transporter permease [Patescibacteria group bacterium]
MEIFNYFFHLGIIFSIYSLLVLSSNLSLGYGGLFNLALPGLALIGAYTSSLLSLKTNLPFGVIFVITLILGYLVGWIISKITNKLRGDYLALVTFGFTFIVFTLALNWESLTRGALGLPSIPKPKFLFFQIESLIEIFIFYYLITFIVYLFLQKLIFSPLGRSIQALRDDELAISVLGRNPLRIKSLVLGISGLLSSLAGILYAHYLSYLDPYSFGLGDLIFILSALFLGGLADNRGALLGTFLLIIIPESLRFLPLPSYLVGALRQIIYSLIIIIILWFRPKGIFGKIDLS